jgi:hypothetical protein
VRIAPSHHTTATIAIIGSGSVSGKPFMAVSISQARLRRWSGPTLNAVTGTLATEEIVLTAQSVELTAPRCSGAVAECSAHVNLPVDRHSGDVLNARGHCRVGRYVSC